MASEGPNNDHLPDLSPARRRRAMRSSGRNTQAIIIAAVPVVVLLAVVIMGVWLVQSRKPADAGPGITPTHLPTLRPATLVAAKRTAVPTGEPTVEPAATTEAAEPTALTEPTLEPTSEVTEAVVEEPTAAPAEGGLAVGSTAQVVNTSGRGLRMRGGAGLAEPTLKVVPEASLVTIIEGPADVDGYQWFKVRDDTGTEGWVAADWLAPTS